MKSIRGMVLMVFLLAQGCASEGPKSTPGAEAISPLKLTLSVDPPEIYVNRLPNTDSGEAQPADVRFTLTVRNPMKKEYRAEFPNAGVAHFQVMDGKASLWVYPENSAQVVTTVVIPAGGSKTFEAVWHVNVRELPTHTLNAIASFAPAGIEAQTTLPVAEIK